MSEDAIAQLISTVCDIFKTFGEGIYKNYSEYQGCCRIIFQEIIFTDVKKRQNNTDSNVPEKYEIEFIQPSDLVMKFEELMGSKRLTEPQKTSLNIVFTSKQNKGNVLYKDL